MKSSLRASRAARPLTASATAALTAGGAGDRDSSRGAGLLRGRQDPSGRARIPCPDSGQDDACERREHQARAGYAEAATPLLLRVTWHNVM